MSDYFEGYYYKHQKGEDVLCLIIGRTSTEKFIQIITGDFSVKLPLSRENSFSTKGVILNICTPQLSLTGKIRYKNLSPICYDIMGPFCLFPMECKHGIISMSHYLEGEVLLNGRRIDFTGGKGYIEKDSGRSFPSAYTWIQANDFPEEVSIVAAVADIPFCGLYFKGCICVIQYQGREYRMATYLGVRVISCTKDRIFLKQGKYRLEIRIKEEKGHRLNAPKDGKMTRTILESCACPAEFFFYRGEKQIFHLCSKCASFEYEQKKV